ncbi:MAG: SWIM zinc finger domain-containing protein [Peptococcaceae bacterium]|nr:SWIM zinc finger domain-containing protein [Peptococcaceae bacterium]
MKITEDVIRLFAGSATVAANGKSLANKGSFISLSINQEANLLFGLCQGSGKTPYACSVDFAEPDKPIARCSCPSRQIPCKHAVGLLFCRLHNKTFAVAEIRESVVVKREKLKARAEKKADFAQKAAEENAAGNTPAPLTKQRASAAVKKCRAQLTGLELAEKILHNIVKGGLHSIDRHNEKLYAEQVKELGNYYIVGVQAALTDLLTAAAEGQKSQDFTQAVRQLSYLHALLQKAQAHMQNRISDLESFPELGSSALQAMLHSTIEERMGTAWKLSELAQHGLMLQNTKLIQLAFRVYEDEAKKEFVDESVWLSLTDRQIYLSKNFRPFKALKYIRAEDSVFLLIEPQELFIYPGDKNPRIRWDAATRREITAEDLVEAQAAGQVDFAAVLREVKNQLRAPLADKNPFVALKVAKLGQDDAGRCYVFDSQDTVIPLIPGQFGHLLRRLSREQAEGQVLVCRFAQNNESLLYGEPVALITDSAVIRFAY